MRYLLAALLVLPSAVSAQIDFTVFKDTAQIVAGMTQIQTRFPAIARVQTIGTSVEGRPIRAIKISDNVATSEPSEGAVVLIATQHAREWLATETALYIAEKIAERYGTDAAVQADVDRLEIFIIPVANPDGWVFSWLDGINQNGLEWRKNRRVNPGGSFGVDLNRNWGFQWAAVPAPADASGSYGNATEAGPVYYGTGPFSEPETAALRDFLATLPNLKTFEDIHTYGELFLAPWRYTSVPPPGAQTLEALANRQVAVTAAVHGHSYTRLLYRSSGGAIDYVWNQYRAAAISPELRPALAIGTFIPSPSEIIPTGQEHLAAVLALLHDAAHRHVWIRDYTGDTGAEPSATWTGTNWTNAFWVSPDIWTTPADLTEGATVTLNIRINNDGPGAMQDVIVEAYWNDPRITLEFPSSSSTLIGADTVNVPPAGRTITMPWTVPMGTNSWGEWHWCVGVVIRHPRDMALTTVPQRSSNVGMKNFTTQAAMAGAEGTTLMTAASNALGVAAELVVTVDSAALPRGWRAEVLAVAPRPAAQHAAATLRKARLLGARGILLEPGEVVLVPVRVTPPRGARHGASAEVNVQAALLPLVAGERVPFGNGFTYRVVVDTAKCQCR